MTTIQRLFFVGLATLGLVNCATEDVEPVEWVAGIYSVALLQNDVTTAYSC